MKSCELTFFKLPSFWEKYDYYYENVKDTQLEIELLNNVNYGYEMKDKILEELRFIYLVKLRMKNEACSFIYNSIYDIYCPISGDKICFGEEVVLLHSPPHNYKMQFLLTSKRNLSKYIQKFIVKGEETQMDEEQLNSQYLICSHIWFDKIYKLRTEKDNFINDIKITIGELKNLLSNIQKNLLDTPLEKMVEDENTQ